MMRLNRVHWLMRFGSAPVRPSRRGGPDFRLLKWFERHGILHFVWRPGMEGFALDRAEMTDKGRADLARAVGEHRAHGTWRPPGGF